MTNSSERGKWFYIGLLAVLGGCGEAPVARVPLAGTVIVENTPIASGSISFLPETGTSGPPATTVIRDGQYQFTAENGPVAGRHRVVVSADAPSPTASVDVSSADAPRRDGQAKQAPSPNEPQEVPNPQVAAPPVLQWEQNCEVKAEGALQQNFSWPSSQDSNG